MVKPYKKPRAKRRKYVGNRVTGSTRKFKRSVQERSEQDREKNEPQEPE